jgi:hypothetical protein
VVESQVARQAAKRRKKVVTKLENDFNYYKEDEN